MVDGVGQSTRERAVADDDGTGWLRLWIRGEG